MNFLFKCFLHPLHQVIMEHSFDISFLMDMMTMTSIESIMAVPLAKMLVFVILSFSFLSHADNGVGSGWLTNYDGASFPVVDIPKPDQAKL